MLFKIIFIRTICVRLTDVHLQTSYILSPEPTIFTRVHVTRFPILMNPYLVVFHVSIIFEYHITNWASDMHPAIRTYVGQQRKTRFLLMGYFYMVLKFTPCLEQRVTERAFENMF